MEYSDPILRRLRDRLLCYRLDKRVNGRKRPWHRVAMDILDADAVAPAFYEKEDDTAIFGEALRRFAAGLQTPTVARLDAITAFLQEQKYLSTGDLEAVLAPQEALRHVSAFFGEGGFARLPAQAALAGQFLAVRSTGGRHRYIQLAITAGGDSGLQVEETEHSTSAPARSHAPRELRRFFRVAGTGTDKRDGWLIETRRGLSVIFIRDRLSGEANVYTVISDDRNPVTAAPADNIHVLKPMVVNMGAPVVKLGSTDAAPQEPVPPTWFAESLWHFSRQEDG